MSSSLLDSGRKREIVRGCFGEVDEQDHDLVTLRVAELLTLSVGQGKVCGLLTCCWYSW